MRGIIFHAGRTDSVCQYITPENQTKSFEEQLTTTNFGWRPDMKPKCLFHVRGEVLLNRIVRIFKEFGIERIRIVVGYKKELIAEYNAREKLGLELVYNPDWSGDYSYLRVGQPGQDYKKGMITIKLGLEGMDDDLLMTYGDVYMVHRVVKEAVENENPLVSCNGHLFRILKSHLHLLAELPNYGGGTGAFLPLMYLFKAHNGASILRPWVTDIDYYRQTDEYKKEHCVALHSQGLSFEAIAEKIKLDVGWVRLLCLRDGYPCVPEEFDHRCSGTTIP